MSRRLHLIYSEAHKYTPLTVEERGMGIKQNHLVSYDTSSNSIVEYTAATQDPHAYLSKHPDGELRGVLYAEKTVLFETRSGPSERWRDNLDRFTADVRKKVEAAWQERYEPAPKRSANNTATVENLTTANL